MIFGILASNPYLVHQGETPRTFKISYREEWKRTMDFLYQPFDLNYRAAADFMPLVAPMLRQRGSLILKIPKPYVGRRHGWLALSKCTTRFQRS